MINFYDCDKNLSETDFNEVEKNQKYLFHLHSSHITSNGILCKIRFKIGASKMKKLLIGMIGTILLLTGALKMSQQLTKNSQYNDLTVGYYLGMTFPKYNHPAKLYDEINLDKVDNIRKSKETISYYIGFYKDGKLIKFEKYINANKVMDFAYEYDEMGNLIKIYKNNIEAGKPIQKRMQKKKTDTC